MDPELRNSAFVPFTCRCGRGLRAKREQVGTEVICWSCHEPMLVPEPHPGARIVREMFDGARTAIDGPSLRQFVGVSLALSAALTIPIVGLGVASLALVFLAAAYGEATTRPIPTPASDEAWSWRSIPRPRSILEGLACLLLVAGTVVPLWVLHIGPNRSPHLGRGGLAALGVAWFFLPMVMLLVYARRHSPPPGLRRLLGIVRRHPSALACALLVVPVGLVLTEAWLDFVFYVQGSLPFFALEHMPIPGKPAIYIGIPHYEAQDFRTLPQSKFIRAYFDGLREGYTFVGSMPPALSVPTRAGINPAVIRLVPYSYAVARFLLVALILTCILSAFSIQARWLGLLADRWRAHAAARAGLPAASTSISTTINTL